MAYNFPEEEKKVLKFWEENKIFEKLREKNKKGKPWSFLDGPITANNPMGVHHAWGRTYKDLLQRYKAMQGFDERYQNGFDCQGLWVEVEVEKELGFKNKKDIEVYGIDKFVEKCKERVRKYSAIQTQQSIRLGQWMDWENSYYTMSDENNYAIWHFLKVCHEKGLVYKGHDSVPWCPRCETAISQHEILTEDYKELVHESIIMQLPIVGREKEYLLVWTTTPWTIPANVAVAVDKKIDYSLVKLTDKKYWVADALVKTVFKEKSYKILNTEKGKSLEGLHYKTIFDSLAVVETARQENPEKFHSVVLTDSLIMPISTEEGTGMVHMAPGAGGEDFRLGKKLGLPVISVINDSADYLTGLGEFSGKNAKKHPEIILNYFMSNQDFLFSIFSYKHRYPACWRCKTELVWKVADEWYISMDKIRKSLVEITKKINWIPEFGKERELDWLKNMHDWLISKKNRYWGLALPVFECKKCGNFEVVGGKEELKKRAVEGWDQFEGKSPHKPFIDNVKIKCKKCGEIVSRVEDVGNPWLDAGIVSFSTMKYFGDKKYWKKWFPANLVCESFPGQFKNWFYSLLVMSAVLEDKEPTETIFGYASVKDEKGEEMHKSKGNAIWFDDAVEKIGADPMRWLYAKQNPAENLGFGYNVAEETKRKLMTLYNSYVFFNTYVKKEEMTASGNPEKFLKTKSKNILDKWIISRINSLIYASGINLDKYDIARFVSNLEDFFINDLSLWYIRRSRKRLHEDNPEKDEAIATFYYILLNTAKLSAPVMPFFAEQVYQDLKVDKLPESVHLCEWPKFDKKKIDKDLENKMEEVRQIVNLALAERTAKGIKVKQPLAKLKVKSIKLKVLGEELLELIKDEVNVKEIIFDGKIKNEVELDLNITEELENEGILREIIRLVQAERKAQNLVPQDKISVELVVPEKEKLLIEKNKEFLLKEFRATEISAKGNADATGAKRLVKIINGN
ncbi:MAG: isoleucine--tRNA ligase [Candidatus Staskawiczbacteria bacterium]|nr:isoleucine--tRNA ligase [Candidatus Staskawiczbacteria bacterium]